MPLVVLLVEPDRTRKRIQETALIIGVCVAVFICGSLTRYPLATEILEGHIAYRMHLPLLHESLALYFAAVSAPCFSSYREIRWFGLGLLGALGLSLLRDTLEFVSLWCFAAALLSGLLTWHFKSSGAADAAAVRTP
ncbi:MAG: hypothetical protein HKP27_06710 [Myxococcales bacterium]|nr:hypothetical protein [Myxococcales bacterium]